MTELSDFEPAPDVARARTLPARWYLDPNILEVEVERVFRRSWQWVGDATSVAHPGDYLTADLFGEPLVVTRAEDGTLRALSNVCRHRAGPVAEGRGNRKLLQCGYHGWTYALDGRLNRAPEMEGVEGLDLARVCLPELAVVEWGPLLFVNLDGSEPSLLDTLGAIPDEVARAGFPIERMRLVERRDYEIAANWKVYVDNFLEGYHIPFVHPALFKEVDYERYRVEPFRWSSKQHAPLRPGRADRTYPSDGEGGAEALYYWVFPNLMLNFYPGNMQINYVVPLDVARTLTVFEWYATGGRETIREGIEFSEQVQREDVRICEIVQKGLASRTYDQGRYSARRENGVHHFHCLLHERVAGSSAGGPPSAEPRNLPS